MKTNRPSHMSSEIPCRNYIEDQCVCYDFGEPKGQCANCGYKWYDHKLESLPEEDRESAARIQRDGCGLTIY